MWFHDFFPSYFRDNCLARVLQIQNVAGIDMISQFSKFFNLIFGEFCHLAQLCDRISVYASLFTNFDLRKCSQLFWTFSKSWDKIKTKERNVKMLKVRSESIQILKLKRNATSLRMCLVGNRNSNELTNSKREMFVCKKWRVWLKSWSDPFWGKNLFF